MSASSPELMLPIVGGVKREFNPGLAAPRKLVHVDLPKLRKPWGQWEGPAALILVAESFMAAEAGFLELVRETLAGYWCLFWFLLFSTLSLWISVHGIRKGNWWNRLLCALVLLLFIVVIIIPLC
jgi:hypothetical protein